MRDKFCLLLAAALLLSIALTGCNSAETKANGKPNSTDPQAAAPNDGVNRISLADARAAFESGKAIIVDVRGEAAFKEGHIKGAQMIDFAKLADKAAELPKDKTIILYCSCPAEHSSVAGAQVLKAKGVENTAALVGGFPKWKEAGYPVETSR
jgi:rhodanese-related sulfurtransferase